MIKFFAWDFIGKISNLFINFILVIVLTRLLNPSIFGEIAIIMAFISIATVFFDAGFTSAIIQRKRLHSSMLDSVFFFNLIIAIFIYIFFFIFVDKIEKFYNYPELGKYIIVASFILIIKAFGSVQKALMLKKMLYKQLSIYMTISMLFSGLISIFLAFNGYGIWSLIFQYVLNELFITIFLWVKSKWRPNFIFSFKAIKLLFKFGGKVFIVSILNMVFGKIDLIIAAKIISPNVLGFYERAKRLNQIFYNFTGGSFSSVVFPYFSKIKSKTNFIKVFYKLYLIVNFIIFFLAGIIYLNAENIILILFGHKWLKVSLFFKLIILYTMFNILSVFISNIFLSRGRSDIYLKLDIMKKIIFLLNVIIGFNFGLIIFLYGNILVGTIQFLIDLYFCSKILKISFKKYFNIFIINFFIFLLSNIFSKIILLISQINVNCFLSFLLNCILFIVIFFLLHYFLNRKLVEYLSYFIKDKG